jgi:hypothetical protein
MIVTCNSLYCYIIVITLFGKIVIVNNELMKNKGTPESQTFKKKTKKKQKKLVFLKQI